MLWVYHIWLLLCWGMFLLCLLSGVLFFFSHKWMLNFVKGFLCIYWDNISLLFFNLLMWCITLIDFQILKNPCIPGIKPSWSWYMIFLICCWILFGRILLRIFASMLISDIGQWFSFFCGIFVWFWYYGDCGLIEWVWEFTFLCNFLSEFV